MGIGSIFSVFGGDNGSNYGVEGRKALQQQYNEAKNFLSPYVGAGTAALKGYQDLVANPSAVTSNPGYDFRFKQGQDAIINNALARGEFGSGNTARALTEYGQNFATDELDKILSRYAPLLSAGFGASGHNADLSMGLGNATANSLNARDAIEYSDSARRSNALGSFADSLFSYAQGKKAGG